MHEIDTRFQDALAAGELDALLVTRDANQRFLEGYTGSECYLLASRSARWLVADSRYTEQAATECRTAQVVPHRDPFPPYADVIATLAKDHGLARIGFEKTRLSYAQYEAVVEALKAVDGATFVPTDGIVERLRMVKDAQALARIQKACALADQALEATLPKIREGISELALARELEAQLVAAGAEGPAFPTIAAFGARASQPHAVPSADVRLCPGDLVLLDFGALHEGHRSDMTRTFVLGKADETQRKAYAAVLEAQLKGIATVRPGVHGTEPDAAAREVVRGHGYPEFGHGLGHGIGLEVHEWPFMSRTCELTLERGMTVTVEPGIYLPGWGGIRIEDTVVVGDSGAECLTRFPKAELRAL